MIFRISAALFFVFALSLHRVPGFSLMRFTTQRVNFNQLSMGGGRSKAEIGLTKKQLFAGLKEKLGKASQIPGFFEVGDGAADIDLYCKSNNDGTQIGDCPFAQFVQLVLLKKGVKYNVRPTSTEAKPDWLLKEHGGKMPCLVHNGVSMTDSLAIAEYIEKTFPHTTLTRQGAYSYQEVLEKTSNFFPTLSALIKNKDESKDGELLTNLNNELDKLDTIIRSTPGQFICGIEITLADYYLLPQLFHAMVTLEHFKGVELFHIDESEPTRPALDNYVSRMFDLEEFNNKKAYYSVDQVVNGWKTARGEA